MLYCCCLRLLHLLLLSSCCSYTLLLLSSRCICIRRRNVLLSWLTLLLCHAKIPATVRILMTPLTAAASLLHQLYEHSCSCFNFCCSCYWWLVSIQNMCNKRNIPRWQRYCTWREKSVSQPYSIPLRTNQWLKYRHKHLWGKLNRGLNIHEMEKLGNPGRGKTLGTGRGMSDHLSM